VPEVHPLSLTLQHLLPVLYLPCSDVLHPPENELGFHAATSTSKLPGLLSGGERRVTGRRQRREIPQVTSR